VAKEQVELRVQLALDLAIVCEELNDPKRTETALRQALTNLEQREAILDGGKLSENELTILTADTWERLAGACAQQNKAEAALAAFDQARKLDPSRAPRLAFHRARILEKQGRLDEALRAAEQYLATKPPETEGYELKLRLLRGLNRDRDRVLFLEAVTERDPDNAGLQVLLGKEYVRGGRPGDAEELYRRVLKTSPTVEVASALLERFRVDGPGGGEKALSLLDRLLTDAAGRKANPRRPREPEKEPDPVAAAQSRALLGGLKRDADLTTLVLQALAAKLESGQSELHGSTRSVMATLAARTNQLELAETLYRSCLRNMGRDNENEPEIYGGLLRVLALAHKYQDIVDVCKQGLTRAQDTNRVLFHDALSRALMALGRSKEAIAAADDAVNESGDSTRLHARLNRAHILAEAGKEAPAVAECQGLLREYNQPGDIREIRHTLSGVYSLGKNLAKAEEQLKLILEADSTDATACNDLGYHYAEGNRNLDEAERLVRRALELDRKERGGTEVEADSDQDNAAFVDSLGWVLFRKGKLAEARRELERAAKLPGGDSDPTIWDHLGDVLARLNEPTEARTAYRKALKLYEAGQRHRPAEAPEEIKKKIRVLQP
jgi:tetratricopeptide (TPR) repeat protein